MDDQTTPAANGWDKYGWVLGVVWLVFLIYPVIGLVNSEAAIGWIVAGWIGLGAFVVIYVTGLIYGMSGRGGGLTKPPEPIQWVAFVALILCVGVTIPAVGGHALSFVPFVMSFASYALTRTAHWVTLACGIGVAAASVVFLPNGMTYVMVLAIIVLLGVVNSVSTTLIIRSVEADRQERELAMSLGRENVARDVHDLIGHSLTVVRTKTQLARRLIDTDPERAKAELADIEALTAEAIAGVRETVAGVRSASLGEQMASSRDALADAGVSLRLDGELEALSPVQSLTASWILREATTNVLRHANARSVVVSVAPGVFTVQDDGGGGAGRGEGNGIRGMRERATMGGASFVVRAGEREGTTVEVTW